VARLMCNQMGREKGLRTRAFSGAVREVCSSRRGRRQPAHVLGPMQTATAGAYGPPSMAAAPARAAA